MVAAYGPRRRKEMSEGFDTVLHDDRTRLAVAVPGAPDRPGRPGLHRPGADRCAQRAPPAACRRAHRAAPDGFGQRAPTGSLPAALQPARALPDRAARPGGPPAGRPGGPNTWAT